MRASLFDLHAAYEACVALTFIYDEGTPIREPLEALHTRVWRAIIHRRITNADDAGTALRVICEWCAETNGDLGPDGVQLLGNICRWFAERD
jgi:hypothetical protein